MDLYEIPPVIWLVCYQTSKVSCILHKISYLNGRIQEMTSDADIMLSTAQTKYDIDMVHYSDVTVSQITSTLTVVSTACLG